MRFPSTPLLVLCALLTAPLTAHAKPYFESDALPPILIAPPPATESEQWKQDVEHIIALQKNPDAAEVKEAADERHMSPELVTLAVDASLKREQFPKLYHLLDRVSDTSYVVTDAAKKYWKTNRPYLADTRVKSLIEPHGNGAYPSGHTCGSYTWAHVLGLLLPQKRDAFYARAEEIAQHRVLVGMHYPHDLDGGRQLALLIVGGLLQNEEFRQDMMEVQKELGSVATR